jgi:hypothetical protein
VRAKLKLLAAKLRGILPYLNFADVVYGIGDIRKCSKNVENELERKEHEGAGQESLAPSSPPLTFA